MDGSNKSVEEFIKKIDELIAGLDNGNIEVSVDQETIDKLEVETICNNASIESVYDECLGELDKFSEEAGYRDTKKRI